MKKPTKGELEARVAVQDRKLAATELAVQILASGEQSEFIKTFIFDDFVESLILYRSTAAHGGLVLHKQEKEGQPPHTLVYWLDDLAEVKVSCLIGPVSALLIYREKLLQKKGPNND